MAINFNNINATQTAVNGQVVQPQVVAQQQHLQVETSSFSQQVVNDGGFKVTPPAHTHALAGLGALWTKAKESNSSHLPDGTYAAIIDKIQIGDTNDGSKPKVTFVYKVVSGEFANRLEFSNVTLNVADQTPEGVDRLEKNLARIKNIFTQYGIDEAKGFELINNAYAEFKTQNVSSKPVELAFDETIGELSIKSVPSKQEGKDPFRNVSFKLGK